MYPSEFEYFAPRTVAEAVQLLDRYGDAAKILAGGQSLLPMMKLRIATPQYVIDVNRIEGLGGVRRDGDLLIIGALCRHAEMAASPVVTDVPILADAAALTADVQVRNRGTVAGSVVHADPAGDWPTALMALKTVVTIAGPAGTRMVPLHEFIVDAYTTALAANEMVTELSVWVPRAPRGGAYVKFERRAGDFAAASVGVQIELADERCRNVAISLGAVGATPIRARAAEQCLLGAASAHEMLAEAEGLVREAAQPFADTRGTAEYKRHLAGVMFRRAFMAAFARARGRDVPTSYAS